GCTTSPIKLKPEQVEDTVLNEMRKRIEQLNIEKHESSKPDAETESIKTEIIRIDSEIQKLMEKLADADSILFDYIQKRVSALHEQKSELDKKMQTMSRRRKDIDTKPLEEPMKQCDKLTVQEKYDLATAMIEIVLILDETGIEVKFSI
ncbi:MAG: resolvase, partial [Ruminococcus sp.]|nr:resolvase [Ruminococcus sp.]